MNSPFALLKTLVFFLVFLFPATSYAKEKHMYTGSETSIPIGWYDFCQIRAHASDCRNKDLPNKSFILTEKSWNKIIDINSLVNREIYQMTDIDNWGQEELWTYPINGRGDCEDLALEKKKRLIKSGFPAQSLLITIVKRENGEGHTVLSVKTDKGDYVLDNLEPMILLWSKTDYLYLKRQSENNPTVWLSVQ